jgi:hypothetical protein
MRSEMTSRERLLAAIDGGDVDHVPFWNIWRIRDLPFRYRGQVERAAAVLALGLDDTLLLEPPLNKTEHYLADLAPGVATRVRREARPEEPYPLLAKEYDTPAGTLRQVVRRTEDWPHGEDVPLFSDFNVSRSLRFPVSDEADLARLAHLLSEPSAAQVAAFRERAADLRRAAKRLGCLLEGGWTALGDAALWLLGTEALLYKQMDDPEFIERLLDVVLGWELRRLDLLLEEGVEVVVHSGWYETTDFFTPATYRRLVLPRLRRLVERTHAAGVRFNAIVTTSWQALAGDFADLGFDSLVGVDPVQGRANLAATKATLGRSMCLWGGLNSAVTLGQGTDAEIERATTLAIETLAPGGRFVLYAVDQLGEDLPWRSVAAAIEAWRRAASDF